MSDYSPDCLITSSEAGWLADADDDDDAADEEDAGNTAEAIKDAPDRPCVYLHPDELTSN